LGFNEVNLRKARKKFVTDGANHIGNREELDTRAVE